MKNSKIIILCVVLMIFSMCLHSSCDKMEAREESEKSQIESFKASIAADTINVYELDGVILDIQTLGTEEYASEDTITLIFTGVSLQQSITFAQDDTVRVVYGDNNLIEGWKIALPYLRKNSSGLLLVTYDKGYGKRRVGVVEPYSTLHFTFSAQ